MNESLPLFGDFNCEPDHAHAHARAQGKGEGKRKANGKGKAKGKGKATARANASPLAGECGVEQRGSERQTRRSNDHLEAAKQLSRRMRSLPDGSAEQRAAGQRICRHLIAMLQAAQTVPGLPSH